MAILPLAPPSSHHGKNRVQGPIIAALAVRKHAAQAPVYVATKVGGEQPILLLPLHALALPAEDAAQANLLREWELWNATESAGYNVGVLGVDHVRHGGEHSPAVGIVLQHQAVV